jgi:hypothetical protein
MSIFLHVNKNATGRDYIVGDIHGHLDQLDRQLKKITFNPSHDRLFCLGDLVDRGPHSKSLLARIDQKTYFSTLGNHEAMMIAGFKGPVSEKLDTRRAPLPYSAYPRQMGQ